MTQTEHYIDSVNPFDADLYMNLRADAVGAGGSMQKRGAALARIMDVLGTARVNSALAADNSTGRGQKFAADTLADLNLALKLVQQAAREGSL